MHRGAFLFFYALCNIYYNMTLIKLSVLGAKAVRQQRIVCTLWLEIWYNKKISQLVWIIIYFFKTLNQSSTRHCDVSQITCLKLLRLVYLNVHSPLFSLAYNSGFLKFFNANNCISLSLKIINNILVNNRTKNKVVQKVVKSD